MSTAITEVRHLGDGVYASFDGYHIVLDLRAQDDTTRISLEPRVYEALVRYREDLHAVITTASTQALEREKQA